MSIADEVRKEHRECDLGGHCKLCFVGWPCPAIRLADVADDLLAACEAAVTDLPALVVRCAFTNDSGEEARAIIAHIDAVTAKAKGVTS